MVTVADIDIPQAIRSHAFVTGMPGELVDTLVALAAPFHAGAGEIILREGDHQASEYLVLSGRAAVEVHSPGRGSVIVESVGPGEQFGWSWLVPPHVVLFDVVAVEPLDAVVLDGAGLRQACSDDPRLGYEMAMRILKVAAGRLAAARVRLLDLYGGGR